jgi:YwiC-like protein
MARPKARTVPREHGAWGQLILPLVTALSLAPSIAGIAFSVASACAFFLHEPVRVWFKRGTLDPRNVPLSSLRRSAILFVVATTSGLSGFALSPHRILPSLVVVLPLVSLSLVLLVANRERTSYGEALAGTTLPSFAIPVLLAGGANWSQVWFVFTVFTVSHVVMTFGVRAVIAKTKQNKNTIERIWQTLLIDALAIVFAYYTMPHSWLFVAAAPLVFGTALAAFPPHPRHLRKIGWFLVGVSVVTATCIWFSLRP